MIIKRAMETELKFEIVSQLNRINLFLERSASMLALERQNKKFPSGMEFSEYELKSLDNSLIVLMTRLLKNPDIDKNIWIPPVEFAYQDGYGKTQWSWLESFFQGLIISKNFLTSYIPIDNPSPIYNVTMGEDSQCVITSGIGNNVVFNDSFNTQDMLQLADELSLLRKALKNESNSPEEDIAIASVAFAEISARNGDKSGLLTNLKSAGKWVFDVATKIGISVTAKVIEGLIGE